jgi:iron complex outermembrane receptor protein
VFAGNPALRPERSRSATVGIVLAPTADFSVSADYYDIAWTDIVLGDCCQTIVNNDAAIRAAGGAGDPRVIRDPGNLAPNGQPVIVRVESNFRNAQRTDTRGVDVDLRAAVRTAIGRFSTRLNGVYVIEWTQDGVAYVGTNGQGTSTIPRLKGFLELGYEQGPVLFTTTINYIHRYAQQLLDPSFQDPANNPPPAVAGLQQNGAYPAKVPSYTSIDLFTRWTVTPNFEIRGSIQNLTDEMPPYDPGFSATLLYDFSLYSPIGRTYRIGFKYKF